MKIPWFRRSVLGRRWLDRIFLDGPDFVWRAVSGRRHWPPYSLRSFVGGAQRFDEPGRWFLDDFLRLNLLQPGARLLDIGCGCGRLAYALATDPRLRELKIHYEGMDVDQASIRWSRRHITPLNPRFRFYHADCYNPSYNPRGAIAPSEYRFPHDNKSFHLILLTSVFTHTLEKELCRYLSEVERLLAPMGTAYASFFLYSSASEAAAGMPRHGVRFPFVLGNCAVNRADYPTNAVAYDEAFVREAVRRYGLATKEPIRYGLQDLVLLRRAP